MHAYFQNFDDFSLISNDLNGQSGITLLAVVRNEIYFLPAFLAHYRHLGVTRFIMLDDRSDDGTREYLAKQKDVMLIGSGVRYGDMPAHFEDCPSRKAFQRMVPIWRTILMHKYCANSWCLQIDIDEFIVLPEGATFADIIAQCDRKWSAILGVMVDIYPATLSELADNTRDFNPNRDWYYDGEAHIRPTLAGKPDRLHKGARHRLRQELDLIPLAAQDGSAKIPDANTNYKPVLINVSPELYYRNSHQISKAIGNRALLPIQHFKFTADILLRVDQALRYKSHARRSLAYVQIDELLMTMEKQEHDFLYAKSSGDRRFSGFRSSGNAIWPAPPQD